METASPATFVAETDAPRLDAWLAKVSGRARSDVQRQIEAGRVSVDGRVARKSEAIKVGQIVRIEAPEAEDDKGALPSYAISYEDDHLAVVIKPAGVIVHPTPGDPRPTLVDALSQVMPLAPAGGQGRPGIVHRLDKDTSGLMVVAKTDDAHAALVEGLKRRELQRVYAALVMSPFNMPTGRIEAPVQRSSKDPTRMAVVASGKPSVTSFRVLESFVEASLLEVSLHTGRMHQIRVHMEHIKHPVLGDSVYGRRAARLAAAIGLARPFLHAQRLSFSHPVTGVPVDVSEPLPDDLRSALDRARDLWERT